MSVLPTNYEQHIQAAVKHYWNTLGSQSAKGGKAGDRGNRRAVTGGKQMDGFCDLVSKVAAFNGLPDVSIHTNKKLELPGFFRPTKRWDLLVVHEKSLVAAVEFKSQAGPSFGNNFNNRTEEALGNALDIGTAFREGAFGAKKPRPWVGWLMFLEECAGSTTAVNVEAPHFPVFPEFIGASYAGRYELLLRKLLQEKHYDGAALVLSSKKDGPTGNYSEPAPDLGLKRFLAGLGGHVQSFLACE